MANVKISQLPAASTPLAGSEEIPLVQGGITKQVTVNGLLTSANLGTPSVINLTFATNVPVNQATGVLPVVNGGTGAATAAAGIQNLLPSYSGNGSKGLRLNSGATALEWVTDGGGTVTSVGVSVPAFLSVSNSPITASGTIALSYSGLALPVLNGGTGVTTSTGTGSVVLSTSPTLVTPLLGTPTSGNFSTGTFTWPTFNQNTTGTAAGLSATLAIASGGTGQITANAAFNALVPSQTGNSGKYLTTNGTDTSWGTNPLGTVTSVDVSGGTTGLTTSGGPITSSGTITIAGTLATTNGGTGLTSYTANGVIFASSTSTLTSGSALTFDGTNLGVGISNPSSYQGNADNLVVGNLIDAGTGITIVSGTASLGSIHFADSPTGDDSYRGFIQYDHTSNYLRFATDATERLRITSTSLYTASGINVGIGTSSTTGARLTVAGAISVNTGAANLNALGLLSGSSGNRIGLSLGRTAQEAYIGIASTSNSIINGDVAGDLDILTTTGNIRFSTNAGASLQATLDTAGNLGLGVTPSAWSAYKVLQINNGSFTSSGTNAFVGSNWYYNGTADTYIATDYATLYRQYQGVHSWLNAASGTAGNAISFTQAMTLDAFGNLGIGTSSPTSKLQVGTGAAASTVQAQILGGVTVFENSGATTLVPTITFNNDLDTGFNSPAANTIGFYTAGAERARIDSSGNLLVGTTTTGAVGCVLTSIGRVEGTTGSANTPSFQAWNQATSGDNIFQQFYTEGGGGTLRGSISYNRAGGLTAYNVTSDYRAKDISGPVTGSGALIDSVPVYMGKMKGATQERPMFIAHETPTYAHTGEKDAVDADGNPVYQQMDASALIPVMWAEIQSLRQRLSAANL